MILERKHTVLLIGLSILLFRLLSLGVDYGISQLSRIPVEFVRHFAEIMRSYTAVIACGVGVYFSILLTRKLHAAHLALVVVIWILALLPLQVRIQQRIDLPTPPQLDPAKVSPLSLTIRLIDGEDVSESVLLDNSNVSRAQAVYLYDDLYQVKLHLTPEGRTIIREATRHNVGKQIGYFLNGDLISSPRIISPLDIPHIVIPISVTGEEAQRIAEGIMK